MTEADKQPKPANPFINAGRPAFADGGAKAKKTWAIVTTVGFGIFWVSALFLLAEIFGPMAVETWTLILAPLGLAIGVLGRVMMVRERA